MISFVHTIPRLLPRAELLKLLADEQLGGETLSAPDWKESARWRRVVVKHGWGVVIYLSDRERNTHFTVIAVGDVDLAAGTCRRGEETKGFGVAWYKDLVAHFAVDPDRQNEVTVPPCLGYYEPDPTCAGGENAAGIVEPACSWGRQCVALKRHALQRGRTPAQVISRLTPLQTAELTRDLASVKPKGPAPSRRIRPGPEAYEIFGAFWRTLAAVYSPRPFKLRKEATQIGDFYYVDRVEHSAYITICCCPGSGKRIFIARVHLRQGRGIHVRLPIELDDPVLDPVREHAISWRDWSFLSAVKGVGKQVSIEAVCRVIKAATDSGRIQIPDIPCLERSLREP